MKSRGWLAGPKAAAKTLPPALARGLNAAAVARIQGSFAGYANESARHQGDK